MSIEQVRVGILGEMDVDIPVRDGTLLRANIFRPERSGECPAVLMMTPYGKAGFGDVAQRFVNAGYACITVDFRGRFASEGEWTPFFVEETGDGQDGYDTVEWIAAQGWCNGKVGMTGESYPAWIQWKTAALRPPHLLALCARSITTDLDHVDWTGAFRPGRRIHWLTVPMAPDLRRRHGEAGPHTVAEATAVWDEVEHQQLIHYLPWTDYVKRLPSPLDRCMADWMTRPGAEIRSNVVYGLLPERVLPRRLIQAAISSPSSKRTPFMTFAMSA